MSDEETTSGSKDPPSYPPPAYPPPAYPPPAYPPPAYPPPAYASVYPPPAYQQPYPPPPYPQYVSPQTSGTNGFAIASLVLGVVWIWWIGSILALVFGYVAKNEIDRSGRTQSGRGMAIAGIVLGWVGVGSLVLFIVILVVASTNDPY